MRKVISTIVLMFVFLASTFSLSTPAQAMGGFSVSPIFPENQNEATRGFFDLRVVPGERQEFGITINNRNEEDATVSVHLITASTNRNGIINYTSPGYNDETMRHAFSDIASLSPADQGIITIPGGGSRTVQITADIPREGFDGIILGSIRVLEELTEEQIAAGGMIVNRYSFVLAVRLQQTERDIQPDFLLGDVSAQLVNHRTAIVAQVRHIQPRMTMGATANSQIYVRGENTPLFYREDVSVNFAPNTVFPFVIANNIGRGLEPGHYIARIQLEHEGRTWNLEHEFEITADEAAGLLDAAVDVYEPSREWPLPLWAMIAIGLGVLLLLLLIILLIKSRKANKGGGYDPRGYDPLGFSGTGAPPQGGGGRPQAPGGSSPQAQGEGAPPQNGQNNAMDQLKQMDQEELMRLMQQMLQQNNNTDKKE